VTIGFDGARMRDSTAFVVTDIKTDFQQLGGLWSRPSNADDDWEVDEADVTAAFAHLMRTYRVKKVYCDPPYWNTTIGEWSVKYPDVVQDGGRTGTPAPSRPSSPSRMPSPRGS
jgi:hypothetical protein